MMERSDNLREAVRLLHSDSKNTLVVVNSEETYVFTQRGVKPLLEIITDTPDLLNGASVADKVTGAATAFILVRGGVKELHTGVISERAEQILTENGISFSADTRVPHIINRTGDGFCPMEMAVEGINEPSDAINAIEVRLSQL